MVAEDRCTVLVHSRTPGGDVLLCVHMGGVQWPERSIGGWELAGADAFCHASL